MIRIRVRRRTVGVVVGFVVTAMVAGAVATSTSAAPEASPEPVAFGAYTQSRPGQSEREAVEALEANIGRQLEVVRVFERWEYEFPDSFHNWLKDTGRSIVLSVKPLRNNGSRVSWPDIANAAPGSQIDQEIRSWAQRIKGYGVPLRVTFHHEPESGNNGVDDDFIAAWRHWVDVFREEGATNAEFMWIMTDYAFFVPTHDRRWAPKWYPGDDWVDSIAADAYNWHNCRDGITNPWKSLEQIIEPFRDFGALHPDKPLWLAEFASAEDPADPDRRLEWLDDARELFKQPGWEQFDGILYFNTNGSEGCRWYIDEDADTLGRYRAMALDPFYAGPAYPPPPTTTTTTTTTIPATTTTIPATTTTISSTTTTTTSTSRTSTTLAPGSGLDAVSVAVLPQRRASLAVPAP